MMATAEQRNNARAYLRKAEDNLAAGRNIPAAGRRDPRRHQREGRNGDRAHWRESKGKDHGTASKELKQALGRRPDAATAEKALRELVSAKSDVEYGVGVVRRAQAQPLVRRARGLVELAVTVVRLGA